MTDRREVRKGQTVYGSDGVKLGRVSQCEDQGFLLESGRFFTEDYLVAYGDVAGTDGERVRLRIAAGALVREEDAEPWGTPPDPSGNANGADTEPLRAGMAEIDEKEGNARPAIAPPKARYVARSGRYRAPARARVAPRSSQAKSPEVQAMEDAALEHQIEEEVVDYEHEAACGLPGPPAQESAGGRGGPRRIGGVAAFALLGASLFLRTRSERRWKAAAPVAGLCGVGLALAALRRVAVRAGIWRRSG
jgi:hypothetical protein